MPETTLLSRRIRDHVQALIADGEEGGRLPTRGELRRRFGGAPPTARSSRPSRR
jgi:hypothetical protein